MKSGNSPIGRTSFRYRVNVVAAYNFARRLQDAARPHALRSRLQSLDGRSPPIQARSDPPNPETKHLVPLRRAAGPIVVVSCGGRISQTNALAAS